MDPCSREILQLCSSPTFHLIIVHICQVYAQMWQANTGARWRQPLVSNSWGVRWIFYFAHIFWSSCIKDVFGGCAVAFLGGRRGALLCGHRRWSPCGRWASPSGGIKHIPRETKTSRHMFCDSSTKRNHKDTNTCGHSASPPCDITHITRETKT